MDNQAAFCLKCGSAAGTGINNCYNCGAPVQPNAAVCVSCGVALYPTQAGEQKSKLVAGLLAIFIGSLGIHNFYLGYKGKAIAQLLITVLTCFMASPIIEIWAIVEAVQIFSGSINKDAKGIPLKE